jgi:soluble lytic murein transglycosylase
VAHLTAPPGGRLREIVTPVRRLDFSVLLSCLHSVMARLMRAQLPLRIGLAGAVVCALAAVVVAAALRVPSTRPRAGTESAAVEHTDPPAEAGLTALLDPEVAPASPADRAAIEALHAVRVAVRDGRWSAAVEHAGRALDIARGASESIRAEASLALGQVLWINLQYRETVDAVAPVAFQGQGTPVQRGVAGLLAGSALEQSGQPGLAVEAYRQAAAAYPLLADRALLRAAAIHAEQGRHAQAADVLRPFPPDAARPSVTARVLLARAQYERLAGRRAEALATLEEAAGLVPALPAGRAAEVLARAGEAQLQAGNLSRAAEYFAAVLQHIISGQAAVTAVTQLARILPDAVPAHVRAMALSTTADHEGTQLAARQALAGALSNGERRAVRLILAGALRRAGRTEQALQEYYALSLDAPDSAEGAEALWEGASLLQQLGRPGEAAEWLEELAARFPASERATEALVQAGVLRVRMRQHLAARQDFEIVLARTEQGVQRAAAHYWLGKLLAVQGDLSWARRHWEAARAAAPSSFYAARAAALLSGHEGTGFPRAGAALVRARAGISDAERQALRDWLAQRQNAIPERIAEDWQVQRIVLLTRAGLWSDALDEQRELVQRFHGEAGALTGLALLLWDQDVPSLSYRAALAAATTLSDVPEHQLPVALQKLLYPLPYLEVLLPEAEQHGIDPLLFYALVRQESAFDPRARSRSDARGLTQVIPSTARFIAAQLGLAGFSEDELYRPVTSARFGAWYLARTLRSFGGNVYFALAGYNGGPGNVARWAAGSGAGDMDVFIEQISFAETQNYVRRVIGNYAAYHRLYLD